ncbi:uncharacterized protein LOC126380315 [Pectinophora gossypiella]|uniref:Uncharacterized protein n=1 Tax=Pectinophora gossypiella TaxID=13191 RepID=A0A1E1W006_PECGO|nr:uncharacterized protein LOC126380315 [Pectinophora gossypiella]
MIRIILILFFVVCGDVGVQSVQYRMHVSKKSKSSSAPFRSAYVFNHFDDDPEMFNAIENHNPHGATLQIKPYSGKRSASEYSDGYNMEYRDKIVYASVADKYNNIDTNNHKNRIRDQMKAPKYDYVSKTQTNVKRMVNGKPSSLESSISKVSKEKYVDKTGVTVTDKYSHKDNHTDHNNYLEPRDYNVAKAEAKYSSHYLPSKIKSDALYERLKSLMHYRPSTSEVKTDYSFNPVLDFHHVDDDDIRTSSRVSYESWPYFFHTPYEYEHTKINSDIQKAKDKRFAVDTDHKVIPVHEHHHDMPSYYRPPLTTIHQTTTPDNPISGHQPFFSFVLHDYFDKKVGDDDPLTFKGLNLGEDSYYDSKLQVHDDYGKRNRRLHEDFPDSDYEVLDVNYDTAGLDRGESATERGYKKKHGYDQHEKGNSKNNEEKTVTEKSHHKYRGFKDFVDSFANRFGNEDHNRNVQYALKKNQDKGEKRKGFHRVYHKDEYQVDNEFYDNNNISSHGEESGKSALRRGGSEGVLQSHSAAALENEADAYNKAASAHGHNYENNKSGLENVLGLNNDFHRYIDVAKKAALSNNADYTDTYK